MYTSYPELLELATQKFVNLVEFYAPNRKIKYNLTYWQLVRCGPERLKNEEKKCLKANHTNCLPHKCMKAHVILIKKVKSEIELQTFFTNKKFVKFTLGEPRPNFINPYAEALQVLGYSQEYTKLFYAEDLDFLLLEDLSVYCVIQHCEDNKCRLNWCPTDSLLSLEEQETLLAKHNDVIQRESFGKRILNSFN